ncbi:MAG: AAA family ATPase [Thermoplasmata archaeon]|nr:AAA family ATPase [Thermoplasmata archaeon]
MDKIKTYVEGLDGRMDGGIPPGHIVLICGTSGSMKSTLSYSIVHKYVKEGLGKALYISLEQNKESLITHMRKLGMDLKNDEEKLTVIDMAWLRTELRKVAEKQDLSWFDSLQTQIESYKKLIDYDLLVLDSLEAVFTIADMENPRNDIFLFFEKLRDLNITSLLISEMPQKRRVFGTHGIEAFLADGIIHLDMERTGTTVGRYLSVVKLREVKHSTDYFPLLVDKSGFKIVTK